MTVNGEADIFPEDSERWTKELAVEFHGNALAPVFKLSCSGTPLKSRPLLPPSVTPPGVTESVALVSVSATSMVLLSDDPPDVPVNVICSFFNGTQGNATID